MRISDWSSDVCSSDLEAGYERAVVQYFGSSSVVLIRLPPVKSENSSQVSTHILDALHAADSEITLRRIDFVGPQIGEELFSAGGLALLFAFMGIAAYIMLDRKSTRLNSSH